MKKQSRFLNAATTGDALTLTMYGTIGADFFGDGITASAVTDALSNSNASSITVRLNSPGGDAFEGVSIYNVLRASGKSVNVIVDGLAASAASIILMAGDTRTVNVGGTVMIHEAMSMTFGNAADMTKMAETLTTVTSGIADIYVQRTGLPKNEILKMQATETWMSADDALAKGFATNVDANKKAVKNAFDLKFYNNVPAELNAVAEADEPDEDETEPAVEVTPEATAPVEITAEANSDRLNLFQRQLELNRRK